jgi:ketosteroid isomerase-like protein
VGTCPTDAVMMRDRARLASLFTPDGALRMPNIPAEIVGREQIRTGGERLQSQWDFFVQTTHPGTIQLDGDTATGRAYIQELARTRDGRQGLNYAIYHDRYQRTGDGWKFTERVYEIRYLDTSPLAGSAPRRRGRPLTRRPWVHQSWPGIGSASAVREAGAGKGSAKYWVSCVTSSPVSSMTLTE